MKTLKKTLCLVLAVVMTVGVLVLPAAAADDDDAFKDEASISTEYRQAVDVLNLLEVLQGANGYFSPKGYLKRVEAATIAARIVLGPDAISGLPKGATKFYDVPASYWGSSVISFVNNKGIVDGNPDGSFAPEGTLTSYQFAKMLLVAMGINGEYTGTYWATNVYVAARTAGLFNGLDSLKGDVLITREQAAQMAMNAITVTRDPTIWNADLKAWVKDSSAGAVHTPLIGLVFGLEEDDGTADIFGRPTTEWKQEDGTVVLTVASQYDAIYKNEKKTGVQLGITTDRDLYVDGVKTASGATRSKNDYGDKSATIEVYGDRVVVIKTYAKKLAKTDIHDATDTGTAYIEPESGITFDTTAFKKDDVVVYTKGSSNGTAVNVGGEVALADATFSSVTAVGASNAYVRLAGEITYLNPNVSGLTIGTTGGLKLGDTGTYYTDSYGNIVDVAEGAAPVEEMNYKYAYVLEVKAKAAGTEGGSDLFGTGATGTAAKAQAKIIDIETGEVKIVNRALVVDGGKYYYANEKGEKPSGAKEVEKIENNNDSSAEGYLAEGLYRYVEIGSDYAFVGTSRLDTESSLTLEKNNAKVGSDYATNSTVVRTVTLNTDKNTGAHISKYSGYKNFEALSGTYTAAVIKTSSGIITQIIVVKNAEAPTTPINYAVYKGAGETVQDGKKYAFYKDGEVVEYFAATANTTSIDSAVSSKENVVFNLTLDGDGNLTSVAEITTNNKKESATVAKVSEDYILIGSDVYYLADNVVIVDKTDDYSVVEVSDLAEGQTVSLYSSKDISTPTADTPIEFIVITAQAAE